MNGAPTHQWCIDDALLTPMSNTKHGRHRSSVHPTLNSFGKWMVLLISSMHFASKICSFSNIERHGWEPSKPHQDFYTYCQNWNPLDVSSLPTARQIRATLRTLISFDKPCDAGNHAPWLLLSYPFHVQVWLLYRWSSEFCCTVQLIGEGCGDLTKLCPVR